MGTGSPPYGGSFMCNFTRSLTLLAAVLAWIAAAGPASAAPIPASGVTLTTFAELGADTDSGGAVAEAGPGMDTGDVFDEIAKARAAAGLPGALRSSARAGGAGGTSPAGATSEVVQITHWIADGPDGPWDVDILLGIDGFLRIDDFANPMTGSLVTSVSLSVQLITETQISSAFSASATLSNVRNSASPDLQTTGGWDAMDFDCLVNEEQCNLDFALALDDALFVSDGEAFALKVTLFTSASMPSTAETGVEADFFNTAGFELSSDTAGAGFTFVPEPSGWLMAATAWLGLAILGLGASRRPGAGRIT